MRLWLLDLGAESLGAAVEDVELGDGTVRLTSDSSTSVTYADLAFGKSVEREIDPEVELKDPSTFTVIGQKVARTDIPTKVDGSAKYGLDAFVDGVVYGKIVRPPSFGATIESIDFSAAESMPGVVGTFRDGDFAGLAAERLEQAEAALASVMVSWNRPESAVTHQTIYDDLVETADEGSAIGDDTGPASADDILSGLTEPLEFTYRAPYICHTPIEPRNAVVEITETGANVWCSTQDPFTVRSAVAAVLELDLDKVVVEPLDAGGAFGSKIVPMAEIEAARLAKAFGRPVKIMWRREEEFINGQFRPAMLVKIIAGLDGEGRIAGWNYDLYSAAYFPEGVP